MRISRSVHARRKVGVLFMLVGLLTGTFSVFGPQALADPITPGTTIGGFEIDGTSTPNPDYDPKDPNEKDPQFLVTNSANFVLDNAGTIDWATVPNLASRLHFDDEYQPGDDGNDQGFAGGAKEFDPTTWDCAPGSGNDPLKDDIHWVLSYPSLSLSNSIVAFAFYREKPEGNTNVVIELNRNSMDACDGAAGRSVGDLILHFDFPGGDAAADLEAYVWNGTAMVPFDVPAGVANASTNSTTINVPAALAPIVTAESLPTSLPARAFGEAAIDLVALQAALAADPDIGDEIDPDILECPGVGFANIRTRSSGSSDQSQLHDLVPEIPIDLSDCASLKVKKVDDLGQAMEGIQFGLFATEAHALAGTPLAQLPTTPPQDLICTTDATGICSFPKVPDGDYWLNELNLPAGYTADPDLPAAVHLEPFQDLDWSDAESEWFVNTLKTGSVVVTKVVVDGAGGPLTLTDITYLDGITFELQDDQGNVIKKRGGGDATCTLVLDDPTDDPSCQIDDVPFGTYDVVEDASTLPAGLSAGPSVPVTVDEESPAVAEVDYENPADPLSISIDKAGPNTANVGDTITYDFNVGLGDLPFDTNDDVDLQPLTSVQVTELVNGSDPEQLFADRCPGALVLTEKDDIGPLGDDWLEEDEIWTYECDHVVTMAEATDSDGTALWNRAKVQGTDRYGRTDTATDDHLVTIMLPDVVVEKTPDDGVILPGDDAEFSITVSNDGPGRANDVVLTDTLPPGIAWSVTDDGGADCGIATGVLTCGIGALAAGADVTITLSGPTTTADCGVIPNTASASASNELEADEDNNSDDGSITVSCADVTVEKTAADEIISAGEDASFSIVVTNLSQTASATDVELTDELPDGIDWSLGGADAADCDIAGTGDDQVLTCDFGTVEAGGSRTVTVSGTTDPADCGLLENTALVSSSNEAADADDNNEDDASITVQCPDLVIAKTTTTPVVSAGDPINFTITVTNNGPGTAFGVTVTDTLPTGAGVSWSETSAACSIAGGVLSCDFGNLADDASASVTLTSATTEASCKSYPNTATADATNDDPVNDSETVLVQCPDLRITKVADDDVVSAGDPIGFTVTVSNAGPGVATAVTLNDPLPAGDGVDWSISPTVAGCTINGAVGSEVLSCSFGDMASGATRSVHVVSDTNPTTELCASADLENTATADATNDAPVQAADSVTIQCPDLQITKVAADASVSAGEDIAFTITVTNGGPGIAYGVTLADEMPDGVDWELDSSTAGAGCAVSTADVLTCGPVDLEDGESFSATVSAATTEDDCALYENTAFADADNDAPVQATDDTLVMCPGLNILKDADVDEPVTAGDDVGFTIEVSNVAGEGVGTAFDVTLDDPLPAGDGVAWSIDEEDGVDAGCEITGDIGKQVLACGPVDLEPGQGFSVHITSDTQPSAAECVSGTLPNTATADASNGAPVTASDTITIQCPDLTITKVADDDVVDAGDDIGFTITVTNAGPGTAYGVEISDSLPSGAGVSWSLDAGTEGCLLIAGVLGCDVGDLAAGESFSVHVTGTTPGGIGNPDLPAACKEYINTATVSLDNDASETASDLTEVICPLDITLEKDGPDLAHRGDEITYELTVTNSGEADLVQVVLTDPICDDGTLTLVDDADGNTTLSIGEVWTYSCTRVITATDPDPLPNTATVVGTDVRGRSDSFSDDHLVDLIAPLIQVVKTVDDETPAVGQTVTYTYVVTNTGDTTLFDVVVVDDVLGAVGTIDELAPAASATLTTTMVVAADSPTRNVATATGEDVLGKTVTDDDDATITVVLGAVIVPPAPPAPVVQPQALPRTGAESERLLILSGVLLLLGGVLLASGQSVAPRHAGRRRQG